MDWISLVIGLLTGGGIGVALIKWAAEKGGNKAKKNIDIQEYWHREFKRLEARIVELEGEKSGRDSKIKELSEEVIVLRKKLSERDREIESLTCRIRELERLMKKFGIDPDCPDAKGSGGN